MSDEQRLIALEKEVEDVLFRLMELEVIEEIAEMSFVFAGLLASLQEHELISFKLDMLVNPENCYPETKLLLESLHEVKERYYRRRKLLTHRDILKIWLRKNSRYKSEFLPTMF
ncbi:hypothetical protein [Solibacillus sp. FSL H8-0538]|uniref:hypothetical protein n=1 Tax=Solibacillus sp. FSL H8-0538 TaxID=2921400 RepID=UPI0030F97794